MRLITVKVGTFVKHENVSTRFSSILELYTPLTFLITGALSGFANNPVVPIFPYFKSFFNGGKLFWTSSETDKKKYERKTMFLAVQDSSVGDHISHMSEF